MGPGNKISAKGGGAEPFGPSGAAAAGKASLARSAPAPLYFGAPEGAPKFRAAPLGWNFISRPRLYNCALKKAGPILYAGGTADVLNPDAARKTWRGAPRFPY